MAQTATNVSAAKPPVGGALYVAPAGTNLPTDATTALANTYISLGYISEDGLTNSNSPSVEWIKAWGGDNVLPVYGSREDTYALKLIEALNLDVLKTVYGSSNIVGTALSSGITVKHNNDNQTSYVFVVETVMKGAVKRIVIPSGSITALEDIVYSDSDALGYGITIGAVPDTNGNTAYEYIKTPSTVVGGGGG